MGQFVATCKARMALASAAALTAAVLAACQATPAEVRQAPTTRPAVQTTPQISEMPAIGVEPVAKGVYIAIDRRQPLTGEAKARAALTRSDVIRAVTEKVEIPKSTTQPAEQP